MISRDITLPIKEEHVKGLEDICNCCGLEKETVLKTYVNKRMDFIAKDLNNSNPIGQKLKNNYYSNRTYNVMREYAFRKLNYTENWIE